MARISFKRKPCKGVYMTTSGPSPCGHGALRGKDYCARHRQLYRQRNRKERKPLKAKVLRGDESPQVALGIIKDNLINVLQEQSDCRAAEVERLRAVNRELVELLLAHRDDFAQVGCNCDSEVAHKPDCLLGRTEAAIAKAKEGA